MNDPTFVEAARKLAERMIQHNSAPSRRIEYGFRLVTSRNANATEMNVLRHSLSRYRQRFAAQPELADKLLSVGESKKSVDVTNDELASYTAIANIMLNLDEFLTK